MAFRHSKAAGLGLLVFCGSLLCGCQGDVEQTAAAMTGGSPVRGREVIRRYGCESCHSIPGVVGARGQVGPPLDNIASRSYLAGRLPNSPDNMIRWIRDPQSVEPGTLMPQMGVTEQDGKDIAAYLYTLR
ncbi:MAG TPA: c-type cytochrome [Thermoanaerobaculia bacterium]|jgi:cytochrome c2|nr:c-type cytochrome [Thermoanaerobaculia bacterium]